MKNIIAIIPARSGSKGLKDKNIKEIEGKPLIAYTIEAALQCGIFAEVMVSTDSPKYAEISVKYGAKVPFLRSDELSADGASSWDVVREILSEYGLRNIFFDTLCLLQPTSPLRTAQDIREAYDLYVGKNADTVFGVCEADHSPLWMNTISEDRHMDHFYNAESEKNRQEIEKYYRINGALYLVKAESVMEKRNIYVNSYAYIMPRERSIDIDDELDFRIAEMMIRRSGQQRRRESRPEIF